MYQHKVMSISSQTSKSIFHQHWYHIDSITWNLHWINVRQKQGCNFSLLLLYFIVAPPNRLKVWVESMLNGRAATCWASIENTDSTSNAAHFHVAWNSSYSFLSRCLIIVARDSKMKHSLKKPKSVVSSGHTVTSSFAYRRVLATWESGL